MFAQLQPVLGEFANAETSGIPPQSKPLVAFVNGHALQRVVPIVQTQTWDDSQLTLISLEVYDDGAFLRYQTFAETRRNLGGPRGLLASRPVFRVEDDLGTKYEAHISGGGGSEHVWRGDAMITPVPPSAARAMRVLVRKPLQFAQTGDAAEIESEFKFPLRS